MFYSPLCSAHCPQMMWSTFQTVRIAQGNTSFLLRGSISTTHLDEEKKCFSQKETFLNSLFVMETGDSM